MPPRQRALPTDFDSRLARIVAADGRQALAGMSRVGSGRGKGRGNQSVLVNVDPAGAVDGAAQLLVLAATAASVAPDGAAVPFDAIVAQYGFEGVPQPQGSYWVHPIDSPSYMLTYSHEWLDGFNGGGSIYVEVDGVLIPEGVIADGTTGEGGTKTIAYPALAGATGRIWIVHGDAEAQTCNATVHIAISDPATVESALPNPLTSYGYGESSVEVAAPTGMAVGDLLITYIVAREPTITSPAGWTRQDDVALAGDYATAIDSRVAGVGDIGASWTWTGSGGSARATLQVMVMTVPGVSSVSSVDSGGADSVTEQTRTVTATTGDTALMFTSANTFSTTPITHSYPASMEELREEGELNPTPSAYDSMSVARETDVSGTVERTVTVSASATMSASLVLVS